MAIATKPEYAKLDDLYLDPLNPRLGRSNIGPNVKHVSGSVEFAVQCLGLWEAESRPAFTSQGAASAFRS